MKKSDMEQHRSLWLATVKQVVEKCFARESQFSDLCPQRHLEETARIEALRKISTLSKQISQLVSKLKGIEQKGGLGFKIVLGEVEELEMVVMCLLLGSRLEVSVARSVRTIQDIMDFGGVRNPSISLQVRSMFRSDGRLFQFVSLGRYIVLDEMSVTLKESVFNRVLGMPSDLVEARCDAEALVGNNKRGIII